MAGADGAAVPKPNGLLGAVDGAAAPNWKDGTGAGAAADVVTVLAVIPVPKGEVLVVDTPPPAPKVNGAAGATVATAGAAGVPPKLKLNGLLAGAAVSAADATETAGIFDAPNWNSGAAEVVEEGRLVLETRTGPPPAPPPPPPKVKAGRGAAVVVLLLIGVTMLDTTMVGAKPNANGAGLAAAAGTVAAVVKAGGSVDAAGAGAAVKPPKP